jgi:chromosome segregation ATPase
MVVDNEESRIQLCDNNMRSWNYRLLTPFGMRGNRGGRSEEDIRHGRLPLPDIHRTIPGNPQYMVNMIQLDPAREHLRETIFYHMFQSTIVVDDLRSGHQLQDWLIRNQMFRSAIVCRTGEKLEPSGILEPQQRGGEDMPAYVFGERAPMVDIENIQEGNHASGYLYRLFLRVVNVGLLSFWCRFKAD